MQYAIQGDNLPVLKLRLDAGEVVNCEAGAMSWMDDEIEMQTNTGGGIGKMFGRIFTGENAFMNTYIARRPGEIAFSSKFPGSISAVRLSGGEGIVVQKGSFLACCGNIDNEVFFQKRISSGFFGGEGFLMRRYHGDGMVFLEIDGSAHEYELAAGDCKIVDTGYLAAMSDTCLAGSADGAWPYEHFLWRRGRLQYGRFWSGKDYPAEHANFFDSDEAV